MTEKRKITDIIVGQRITKYDQNDTLIDSIRDNGLINPITIDENNNLICGYHRLEAFKQLGLDEIDVIVKPNLQDYKKQLLELDENLCRNSLSEFDKAALLGKRQELYKQLNNSKSRFTQETAKLTGVSQRSIQQSLQINKNITDDVKEKIKGSELENKKVKLLEISREAPEKQSNKLDEILKQRNSQSKNVSFDVNDEELPLKYKIDFYNYKIVINNKWEKIRDDVNLDRYLKNIIKAHTKQPKLGISQQRDLFD